MIGHWCLVTGLFKVFWCTHTFAQGGSVGIAVPVPHSSRVETPKDFGSEMAQRFLMPCRLWLHDVARPAGPKEYETSAEAMGSSGTDAGPGS